MPAHGTVCPPQGSPGVVTCMDNRPHGLQGGQSVLFREVNGMQELNGSARPVTGTDPKRPFELESVSCTYLSVHFIAPKRLNGQH